MKILIIDNEMTRQRNLRSILTSLGSRSADIENVDDPSTAVATMKKKSYNMVFIYRELSKGSGTELAKEIRTNSRLRNIPLVIYSSEVNKDTIMETVQAGANAFLGYPFSVSDVESAMAQAAKAALKASNR